MTGVLRSTRTVVFVAVIVAAALVAVLVVGDDSSPAASKKKQFTIGYVPPVVAPFEAALRKGLQLQAKKYGMKVTVAGGQFDPKVQIAAVKSLLARGVDALVVVPLDGKALKPSLDEARKKKIPIVVYDGPNTTYDVNFQANDIPAALAMAKYAAKKAGKPCKAGIIEGLPVVPILDRRNKGNAQGAKKAGCEILDKQVNPNDAAEKSTQIATSWKTRYGSEMNVILTYTDPTAFAAASQISGRFRPAITGFNGDPNVIEAIKKGRIAATASFLSPELGNGAAFAAWQLLNRKKVPRTINAPYKIITKENVASYKSYAQRLKGPMKVSFPRGRLTTKLSR